MKIVELQDDIYPFGCKGDVVGLSDAELTALDKEAKKRNVRNVYNVINRETEEDSAPNAPDDGDKSSPKKSK